jgi:hypothetical protein
MIILLGHGIRSLNWDQSQEKHRFTLVDDYDQNKGLARIGRGTGGFRGHVSSLTIKVKK